MKTSPVTFEDLSASVLAVPPLARRDDYRLNKAANEELMRYLERGGVTTLLYGGNANFYNISLSEYAEILTTLAETAASESWVIPSAGPSYGMMMDQVEVLRDYDFPTVMVLPLQAQKTPAGVETGLRRFAERFGKPIVIYLKFEGYLDVDGVRRLVKDGVVSGIKYAVVRDDPTRDDYLSSLCDAIDRRYIISGIGERPAIVHLRDFGLNGFTSGSVCVAPQRSTELLKALKGQDYDRAELLRQSFLPLEDLRDGINPIRVLHDAVTLAGIADMGPILPLMSNLSKDDRERVAAAARELAALDQEVA
ncbi:MAG: dihydrodipicolinate synthase family protein [Deinococcota bacterium]|jgi:dihydrodipicolinate synthase/N-acetylneuraminate lyase|nr:dihydrodipicolinate synthase family protein [Deinococcota bacterium]MDQ3458977.1 dihydrodipicolinate synthase family protein [Deinococcota bacterium]